MLKLNEKMGLHLTIAVYSRVSGGYAWGPGVRTEYIIHYVKSGKGFFECMGKKYSVGAGQCFLIVPGALVSYCPDPDDPWEYAWVDFYGEEAAELISRTNLSADMPVTGTVPRVLAELFRIAAQNFESPSPSGACEKKGLLYLLLAYFIEHYPAETAANPADQIIRQAEFLIKNNYYNPGFNIESLAESLSISRTSLYRHFLKYKGISPKDYLMKLRMKRAVSLLEGNDYSIKNIAYSVGFSDQLYFSKVFKKETGYTPREYRRSSGSRQRGN